MTMKKDDDTRVVVKKCHFFIGETMFPISYVRQRVKTHYTVMF